MSEAALRPVNAGDRGFLLLLYASTREAELSMVPWTPDQKRAFVELQFAAQSESYRERYPEASHDIIQHAGTDAGRIYFSREPERIHILDITVAPHLRSRGIGGTVLASLIEEADHTGRRVSIYVESFNPSVRLFGRLGFRIESQDGFQLMLVRPPASPFAGESCSPPEAGQPGD